MPSHGTRSQEEPVLGPRISSPPTHRGKAGAPAQKEAAEAGELGSAGRLRLWSLRSQPAPPSCTGALAGRGFPCGCLRPPRAGPQEADPQQGPVPPHPHTPRTGPTLAGGLARASQAPRNRTLPPSSRPGSGEPRRPRPPRPAHAARSVLLPGASASSRAPQMPLVFSP